MAGATRDGAAPGPTRGYAGARAAAPRVAVPAILARLGGCVVLLRGHATLGREHVGLPRHAEQGQRLRHWVDLPPLQPPRSSQT